MKTAFISLLVGSLLGVACFVSGFFFDAGTFIACWFVACLLTWTIAQYGHKPRPLAVMRPIRLPVLIRLPERTVEIHRTAA